VGSGFKIRGGLEVAGADEGAETVLYIDEGWSGMNSAGGAPLLASGAT
jgi:hypothetical protein